MTARAMELPDLDTTKALGQFGLLALLWLRVEVRLSRVEQALAEHLRHPRSKSLGPLLLVLIGLTGFGCRTQLPQSGQITVSYPPGTIVMVWTNSTWQPLHTITAPTAVEEDPK
jgi:hypothetical protein